MRITASVTKDNIPVKLNNPLMGTETWYCDNNISQENGLYVKLNNPLMGTETQTLKLLSIKRKEL